MIIIDSSIWIEFLKKNDYFFTDVRMLLEQRHIIGLEWIFGELLQGARNKREIEIITTYWDNIVKIPTHTIWIEAGLFSSENRLYDKGVGLIDAAIIVAARRARAKIWSLDKKLNSILTHQEKYIL